MTTATTETNRLLLVDDRQSVLDELTAALKPLLPVDAAIQTWRPQAGENVQATFASLLTPDVAMVVTDDDLTTGVNGFFGYSIVGWCQQRYIPVGNFSRAIDRALPQEPNLFEIRVPHDNDSAAAHINVHFRGFTQIDAWLATHTDAISAGHRPAELLTQVLGEPAREEQLSPFMAQLGPAHSTLLDGLRRRDLPASDKRRLLTYVLGHILANAVLKYPGPVLHLEALAAYCATTVEEAAVLQDVFASSRYDGPFSRTGEMFWRDLVDERLDVLVAAVSDDGSHQAEVVEDVGGQHRQALSAYLGRELARHPCERCGGVLGGYWCPLTPRAVCAREDCSIPTSSWIPRGANLSRVERDFFDEWSPLLGF